MHPQSTNLSDRDGYPCATKTEISQAPGCLANVTSLLQKIHFCCSYSLLLSFKCLQIGNNRSH